MKRTADEELPRRVKDLSTNKDITANQLHPTPTQPPQNDTPQSPVEAPPPSPRPTEPCVHETPPSPMETPSSPIETPPSPVEAPPSPIEAPQSPVEAPPSPIETPLSPMETLPSPVETPPSPKKTPGVKEIIKKADHMFGLMCWKQAFGLYKQAEKLGVNSHVYFRLGVLYNHGDGVLKNKPVAIEYFSLAFPLIKQMAEAGFKFVPGDAEAQCNLASMYDNGYSIPMDKKMAAKYYQLSADQGYPRAQYNLAGMWDDGDGLDQNKEMALKYYKMASKQKHVAAQFNLGCIYYNGDNVKVDKKKALKYYKLAADQGAADALYTIGTMYENGDGVKMDLVMAIKYMIPALKQSEGTKQFDAMRTHVDSIYDCTLGHVYQIVGVKYLAEEWPNLHAMLNPNCAKAILELFYSLQRMESSQLPIELIVLLAKSIIVVWPENHVVKKGEAKALTT